MVWRTNKTYINIKCYDTAELTLTLFHELIFKPLFDSLMSAVVALMSEFIENGKHCTNLACAAPQLKSFSAIISNNDPEIFKAVDNL